MVTVTHCPYCNGTGREQDGRDWLSCWRCNGTGHIVNEEQVITITVGGTTDSDDKGA